MIAREDNRIRHLNKLPSEEKNQPDPLLQMTTGRMGAGGITLMAIGAILILAVVFYGLNGGKRGEQTTATAPPPIHNAQPQAGGKGGAATPGPPRANQKSGVKG